MAETKRGEGSWEDGMHQCSVRGQRFKFAGQIPVLEIIHRPVAKYDLENKPQPLQHNEAWYDPVAVLWFGGGDPERTQNSIIQNVEALKRLGLPDGNIMLLDPEREDCFLLVGKTIDLNHFKGKWYLKTSGGGNSGWYKEQNDRGAAAMAYQAAQAALGLTTEKAAEPKKDEIPF